jgi:two-component system chemotaxis response regulator CheY
LQKIEEFRNTGDEAAICICDVNMPEMDGISFIKEFRKSDRFTPILVLTTESESSKISEGKNAGASGWIVKPFKPEELLTAMERLVR